MDVVWDAELRVWDAKNFGPVSPGTHRKKSPQQSLLSFKMRLRSSSSSFASSSLDLSVTTSSGSILQICLIMALSLHCRLVLVSGHVSLAWSMVLCLQELYTLTWVLLERWRDVKPELLPGCFHASSDRYFTASNVKKACHPGSRRKLPSTCLAYQVRPELPSVVCRHFPCTMHTYNQDHFIAVIGQLLGPTDVDDAPAP